MSGPASSTGGDDGLESGMDVESAGILVSICDPPHLPTRRQAARDGVSQERRKNMGEMAGEARFSREMAAARGLIGDPAQARRDSPDPGRRHDGRGHLAAILLPSLLLDARVYRQIRCIDQQMTDGSINTPPERI